MTRPTTTRREPRVVSVSWSLLFLLPLTLVLAGWGVVGGSSSSADGWPNLTKGTATVACADALVTANKLALAAESARRANPDYSGLARFGFQPPMYDTDYRVLMDTVDARRVELDAKVEANRTGKCTDQPKATITDAKGAVLSLPLVDGSVGQAPISGSVSNADSRTPPVTTGTNGNSTRTNTWSQLDELYGTQSWYIDCANSNLGMSWGTDVPKYMATEGSHDNRFILAVNVSSSLTDDQIRQRAASDGNPSTSKLQVVRTASIINTRHMDQKRCDQFVDTRSMIRVSLGKVVFDAHGNFVRLETDKGIFVDCHNMWQLPRSQPVPTTTTPVPTSSMPPGTTPPSTPPTTHTTPPATCTNGGVPPKCLERKDPGKFPKPPTSERGSAPAPTKEPRPSDPPATYVPPPPPAAPSTTSRSVPPPVVPPSSSQPPVNTTAPCAPGIPSC